MVLASHIIFPMLSQYQIYIICVIAQMVLASHIIFPMLSQYQIYIICVIAQMVLASHIIFSMISVAAAQADIFRKNSDNKLNKIGKNMKIKR